MNRNTGTGKFVGIIFLSFCPFAVLANELPDAPTPKPSESTVGVRSEWRGVHTPKFWDKPAVVAGVATVGLLAWDSEKTCHNLANGGHEYWLHTQRCSTAVLEMGGERVLAWGAAYALHRWHHDRLARVFEWIGPAGNASGLAFSYSNHSR